MDWDALRFFLRVARDGGLSPAARTLGVNHATVLRRIRALEAELGVRLFDKSVGGYTLTPAGESITDNIARMEQEADAAILRIQGLDLQLRGEVRITTVDTLADRLLAPALPGFRADYPGLRLQIATLDAQANLSRREADVALRPSNDPGDTMVGRRAGRMRFKVYGPPALIEGVEDWRLGPHLRGADRLANLAADRWFSKEIAGADKEDSQPAPVIEATSFLTMAEICAAGAGFACLPAFIGDPDPRLAAVATAPETVGTDLWVLTHREIRRAARIKAVTGWLTKVVSDAPL
ncbi:MAG: LysR family transcriptional regulator [Alphaproteobacteria bacterium]|nr:LysR family transcriptional regulator [Alphaproteobacteria bacterium]